MERLTGQIMILDMISSTMNLLSTIPLPCGRQSSSLQFSNPRPSHVKRDLDFITAKCKGEVLYQRIESAYADPDKGREFDAFNQEITKGTKASSGDMTQITLRQDKYFKLDDGTEIKVSAAILAKFEKTGKEGEGEPGLSLIVGNSDEEDSDEENSDEEDSDEDPDLEYITLKDLGEP
ncbi:MAG: hypothetical protein Q9181_003471 [Wetmoreana brouardii]